MSDLLLEIVEGQGAGGRLPLDRPLELGRDPSLPYALDDPKVSRRHARVSATGEIASVEDLGSRNGTFLNESPLEIATAIRPGDRIRVGLTVLELRPAAEAARAAPPAPQITRIDAEVLAPVPNRELVDVPPPPGPDRGGVRVEGSEPRYVNTRVAQRIGAELEAPAGRGDGDEREYAAVQRLADARVKPQTNAAAFALIAIAALVVIIYFGAR